MNKDETIKRPAQTTDVKNFFKKQTGCPICFEAIEDFTIDYKNPHFLSRFVSEGGRILPSRITNICFRHQRKLKKAILLSRVIALMPFVYNTNTR